MKINNKIIHKHKQYNAVLVRNKFGYWIRRSGENPGLLIKAVPGMPTKEQAFEESIKFVEMRDHD